MKTIYNIILVIAIVVCAVGFTVAFMGDYDVATKETTANNGAVLAALIAIAFVSLGVMIARPWRKR